MNLFDMIKNKKYKEAIKFIKDKPDMNLNIQDDFQNYFAVMLPHHILLKVYMGPVDQTFTLVIPYPPFILIW